MRALLAVLLAGCAPVAAVLDPPLARWEAGTGEPLRCTPGHPACMGLAMASQAPGASCPGCDAHLRCVVGGYVAGRAVASSPLLALAEAQAALCLAGVMPQAEGAILAARAVASALLAARPGAGPDPVPGTAAPPLSREADDLARRSATLPDRAGAAR